MAGPLAGLFCFGTMIEIIVCHKKGVKNALKSGFQPVSTGLVLAAGRFNAPLSGFLLLWLAHWLAFFVLDCHSLLSVVY
jgi:hypothetical protein